MNEEKMCIPEAPIFNPMCYARTANQAFEQWYEWLNLQAREGKRQASRDGAVVGEFLNAVTVISNPRDNIIDSKVRNMSMKYAVGELLWYMSGSNMLSDIKPYAKFWEKISDDGDTINSAYGHRIATYFGFDQWQYVIGLLRADPMSRQAIVHIKDANNKKTKDVPCTVALQYMVREGKLYATTFMRSNDIWLGFPYDIFSFTCLQIIMAMELGVDVGTYTHIAGSLHLYERNAQKSEEDKNGVKEDTCQNPRG